MFHLSEFIAANVDDRSTLITKQAALETCPDGMTEQLQFAFKASKVINRIIDPYIERQIEQDAALAGGSMLQEDNFSIAVDAIFNDYRPSAVERISELRPVEHEIRAKRKNLYQMVGATELAFANDVTRNISTTMGPLWEKIADISPYAINPETEFGVKIVGIDLILKNTAANHIEYAQLKTQRNTLTGGQSGRVDTELSLHEHPVFCACFDTKQTWNYSSKKNIPKLCGAEFWSRINIDYDLVTSGLEKLFAALEDSFVEMLGDR